MIRSFAPTLDPGALGYPVTAFCTLEIRQVGAITPSSSTSAGFRSAGGAYDHGSGDLLIRVVARDNADLQRVIDVVVDDSHVIRASTAISLATWIDYRTLPLVTAAAG